MAAIYNFWRKSDWGGGGIFAMFGIFFGWTAMHVYIYIYTPQNFVYEPKRVYSIVVCIVQIHSALSAWLCLYCQQLVVLFVLV